MAITKKHKDSSEESLAAEGVQAGEVEQRAWNDEAAWGLAALAEAAGAERDSDDYGTWWTLRIEHFNALSQQPEARGVVDSETERQLIDAAAGILNDRNGKIGKKKFRGDAAAVVRRVVKALTEARNVR